jgi:soluble cytochrome b562
MTSSKICFLLAENGENVEAAQLKAEVTALRDSVHGLLQAVLMQVSSVGQDLIHWQDYRSGLQEVKPWIEEAEVKVNVGIPKPASLQEAQNLLSSTRVCI